MKLAELLKGLAKVETAIEIGGLSLDSRHVRAGDAFIALNGAKQHGMLHVGQAIANGAVAVIYDSAGLEEQPVFASGIAGVAVAELDRHLGDIAAEFYGEPSRQLAVIGITGTNGKTTCSQLIAQALADCGVIGTLGWGDVGHLMPTVNTTPDALAVQQMLQHFVRQGKRAAAMEVSSHGLQQGRVNGVAFKGAVFTNLSRDHLDYHGTMDEYLQAKLGLFADPGLQFAAINLDDPSSARVLNRLADGVRRWTYSASGLVVAGAENVFAENVRHSAEGIHFDACWGDKRACAFTPIVGTFNLENVLAVLTVLLAMAVEFDQAVAKLAQLKAIAGRMEKFGGAGKPTVFVDYAHTPDALEKVLKAIAGNGHLAVVFGCGGDRDKGKRPEMGRIATNWADRVIVTDDNPRSEDSAAIIQDILAGCQSHDCMDADGRAIQGRQAAKVTVINDRATAISTAIREATSEARVVIAGKGHENYQEINGCKLPFSDSEVVKQALEMWGKS